MFRCFERESFKNDWIDVYEVVNLNQYYFEWYIDNQLVKEGLIDDMEEAIEILLNEGFQEVE